MTRYALAAATAALLLNPVSASAADQQAAHIAHIEASLQPSVRLRGRPTPTHTLTEEMASHHTPAVTIAVVDHGEIIWAKAYGLADVATGRAATIHTPFQAGSVSKPVAASGAMQLIQEGRLALDVPVNQQLTGWKLPDNAFTKDHPVTLRHLLTHTGGLTVHGFPGYAVGAPLPSVVQVLEGKPPANTAAVVVDRQPGTIWNYSGGGITIAQLMMTEAAHKPFPDLMHDRVLAPVGMADSTYEQPLPQAVAAVAASGYLRSGAAIEGRFHTYPEMAAAGLWTTPSDLAKWSIALERAYDGTSTTLMSQACAKAMLTEGLGHWGLGIELGGSGRDFYFTHGGDDAGFKTNLVAWPSGRRAIIAMANGDDGAAVVLELIQAVEKEYGWSGLEPTVIDTVRLSEAQTKEVVGRYAGGVVVISADGPMLKLIYSGVPVALIPEGHDLFLADPGGSNAPVQFNRGPDGQIKSLSAQGLTVPKDR